MAYVHVRSDETSNCSGLLLRLSKIRKLEMFLWFLTISSSVACLSDPVPKTELVLSHVIFRHGPRTTYRTYPTDPHKHHSYYPYGQGGLTNEGKMTVFRLGEYIRKEYNDFLGDMFVEEFIEMHSTYTSRTMMSAQLVLAGMWPPNEVQRWNPNLNWQPIPVHYKLKSHEDVISPSMCTYRTLTLLKQPKIPEIQTKFIKPYKKIFNYIKHHSGFPISDPATAIEFYFIVNTEHEMNLTLPSWTEKIYPYPLTNISSLAYDYLNYNENVKKINMGYLLKKIIDDSIHKIKTKFPQKHRKMILYSGHESTLGHVLYGLKMLENKHIPAYGSAILIDVRKDENDNHYIQIRYEYDLDKPPAILTIPDCGSLCPFKQFISLYKHLIPKISFRKACQTNV